MANENMEIPRQVIHQMLNIIKRAEIENAKTMKYSDKDMVTRLSNYILGEVKKQVQAEDNGDGEEATYE